jgi:UDP-glucose 4-epimerase
MAFMTRFVVTGGAGFIGSHIVEGLLENDHEVVIIDDLSTGRQENVEIFKSRVDFQQIDLRNLEDVRKAVDGAEYIFHQAALPSVPRSIENPLESHHVNVTGTINLLIAAKDAGVKRLVYAASSSAYGDAEVDKKHEQLKPAPLSPYGAAKLSSEYYCQAFYHSYGLETVCLRYFNVFGPRQNPYSAYTGVLAIFIPLMLKGEQPTIFGDGLASRDFTFVKNNVDANLLALTAENAPGEVINIACGHQYTILDIVDAINEILGTDIKPKFADARAGDIKHSLAAIDKAKDILQYEPKISFKEGLKITIDWYREELGL